MTLRNRGEPARFSKLAAPLMTIAMRRANRRPPQPPGLLIGKPEPPDCPCVRQAMGPGGR